MNNIIIIIQPYLTGFVIICNNKMCILKIKYFITRPWPIERKAHLLFHKIISFFKILLLFFIYWFDLINIYYYYLKSLQNNIFFYMYFLSLLYFKFLLFLMIRYIFNNIIFCSKILIGVFWSTRIKIKFCASIVNSFLLLLLVI
jgi:hypothetical protein